QRIQLARAYVLHQRPFRDSSLILEVYAREHGRLTLFAHGARGLRARFGALQPFQPLLLSWSGRSEAPSLSAAERADAASPRLPASQLMSGFYLNEQLLKLLGYGLNLAAEADTGEPVRAETYYRYQPGVHGFVVAEPASRGAIAGHVLHDLAAGRVPSADEAQRQARALMRAALDHCLEG